MELTIIDKRIWVCVRARKTWRCLRCNAKISVGDTAYKRVTNTHARTLRLCPACARVLAESS